MNTIPPSRRFFRKRLRSPRFFQVVCGGNPGYSGAQDDIFDSVHLFFLMGGDLFFAEVKHVAFNKGAFVPVYRKLYRFAER